VMDSVEDVLKRSIMGALILLDDIVEGKRKATDLGGQSRSAALGSTKRLTEVRLMLEVEQ
jgi:hypothetical protein